MAPRAAELQVDLCLKIKSLGCFKPYMESFWHRILFSKQTPNYEDLFQALGSL